MILEYKSYSLDLTGLSYKEIGYLVLVLVFAIFHIWMLLRALFRGQWIWLLIVFFFPVVGTVIYYFVSR